MIANELLEALIKYEFPPKTSLPQRICFFVIRQTYGYHKKTDVISISQFQLALNEKNRTNMIYWLTYLVQAKILFKTKAGNSSNWQFNKDYDVWLPLVQVRLLVQVRSWNGASTDTKTSARTDTHKRKKETTKEITHAKQSFADKTNPVNQIFELFYKTVNPTIQFANKTQRDAAEKLIARVGIAKAINATQYAISIQGSKYAPTISTPIQLLNKYGDLQIYYQKNNRRSDLVKI